MKTTILSILFLLGISYAFGQDLKIVYLNNFSNNLSGTTIEVVGDKNGQPFYVELRVVNESAQPVDVRYERKRTVNSGRVDAICDNFLCIDAEDEYSWTTPQLNLITLENPGTFKPQISPDGEESCAVHDYYVVDSLGVALDSITIIFKTTEATCNLSTNNEKQDMSFSIYPNPVQDILTLKGEAIKNGGTVVFLDALGKEVKRSTFTSSNQQVNVSSLRRGIYFVNILDQSGTKSTVQRLIKQ